MTVSDYNFCSTGYCWAAWQTMSWQMRPALWPSSRTLLLPMVSSSIMPPSMGSWDRFVCWGPKNLLWFVLWWDDVSGGLLGIWLISVSQGRFIFVICFLISCCLVIERICCCRIDLRVMPSFSVLSIKRTVHEQILTHHVLGIVRLCHGVVHILAFQVWLRWLEKTESVCLSKRGGTYGSCRSWSWWIFWFGMKQLWKIKS